MPKQRNAEQLCDKLLAELYASDDFCESGEAALDVYLAERGERDCFYCRLAEWVLIHKFTFVFGPEACLAKELQRVHVAEKQCMVSLYEAHDLHNRTHAERMFRLNREAQFLRQQHVSVLARLDQTEARLRDLGYESGVSA